MCCCSPKPSASTSSATHQALEKSSNFSSTATTWPKLVSFLCRCRIISSNLFISHGMPEKYFTVSHWHVGCTSLLTVSPRLVSHANRAASSVGSGPNPPHMPACWFTESAQIQYVFDKPPMFFNSPFSFFDTTAVSQIFYNSFELVFSETVRNTSCNKVGEQVGPTVGDHTES